MEAVQVAVRIRPQSAKEIIDNCSVCTNVTPNEPQIWLGKDKAFTFDHVFEPTATQLQVYDSCVKDLVEGCLEGYNATIVAYGQTGSGKTYTMGTAFAIKDDNENGIIQRAVDHLFHGIAKRQEAAKSKNLPIPEFKVTSQFLELYNEDIIDLLSDDKSKNSNIKIHEDENGSIYTMGTTSIAVKSPDTTLQCLHKGALCRQTGSTNMNAQSSRSHAIFTIFIKQQRVVQIDNGHLMETETTDENRPNNEVELKNQEFETLTAKFNFVDLAGSERLKRTGATGDRAKEGISINSGLLALGNVISALGDKRDQFVPYRNSKLTRLLQDSLGGNSRTLMIACISPSDRDFIETLGTLRYANRAKNIRNKVVANQDKSSQTISLLRKQIEQLELELQEYRQGKRIVNEDGIVQINDMYHENNLLQTEINNLKTRIKVLQDTNDRLQQKNTELLTEKELNNWIVADDSNRDMAEIVKNYITEIEQLRTRLIEMDETSSQLRKQIQKQSNTLSVMNYSMSLHENFEMSNGAVEMEDKNEILDIAKSQLEHLKKISSAYKKKKEINSDENENINPHENSNSSNSNEDDISDEQEEEQNDEIQLNCDTDDEEDSENSPEHQQLYSLSNEIEIKEKLISEIEKNKRNLDILKYKYENQVKLLTDKITLIESERDQVLSMLNQNTEKSNKQAEEAKIKDRYEKQVNELRERLKKLQSMYKQHSSRDMKKFELQINTLKNDVAEMKRQKVKLLQKLKDETQKHRQLDLKNTKKIIQLTKQERVKDVKIKSLETERNRIKNLLKRKDEEVSRLKKSAKPLSDRAAGRMSKNKFNSTFTFNQTVETSLYRSQVSGTAFLPSKKAKGKWRDLESNISKLVLQKQNIIKEESKMESILSQRDELYKQMESANRKLENALKNNQSESYIKELHEEVDGYHDNIKFLNQQLNECQSVIVMIEEQKEEIERLDLNKFLCKSTYDEVYYLFEKLFSFGINFAMTAAQKQQESKKLELKCKQLEDSKVIEHNLLTQMLDTTFLGDMDIGVPSQNELNLELLNDGGDTLVMNSTYIGLDSNNCKNEKATTLTNGLSSNTYNHFKMPLPPLTPPTHHQPTKFSDYVKDEMEETNHLAKVEEHIANLEKQQRLQQQCITSTASTNSLNHYPYEAKELKKDDYLSSKVRSSRFASSDLPTSDSTSAIQSGQHINYLTTNNHHLNIDDSMTQSMISSNNHTKTGNGEIKRIPSAPSLKDMMNRSKLSLSPTIKRKLEKNNDGSSKQSLNHSNNALNNVNDYHNRQYPMDVCDIESHQTPPASPSVNRRHLRDENVFSRLASTNNIYNSPDSGIVVPFTGKPSYSKNSYLVCSHIAEGHSRPVLCVTSTDQYLFSGSKDCTVKVWDLHTGKEIQSLRDHPDSVTCIRYNEQNHALFTVSKCFINIWDTRTSPYKYERTICSSGLWESKSNDSSDPKIFDIQLSPSGNTLYSTCLQIVRVWNLHKYYSIGKLNPNHQANVTCIGVDRTPENENIVVTGSKDHQVKVFSHPEDMAGLIHPQYTYSPHFDGIESLAINYPTLFSASRDGCIKKWSLNKRKLIRTMNMAHKDSVQALKLVGNGNDYNNDLLVSGCKGGILKVWDSESCKLISEIKAHSSSINSIDSNSNFIFTGSTDNTIGFWVKRSSFDPSPDTYSDHLFN